MAEAARLLLAGIGDVAGGGQQALDDLDVGLLAAGLQRVHQLVGIVEMVLDRALAAAGDEDQFLDPGGAGLFDGVLDQRLVDDGQHFLRHRLGGGQETRAETADREDGLAHRLSHDGLVLAG